MIETPTLFDGPGQARHTDPSTSHAAAAFIRAKATTARVQLLHAHRRNPDGLTDEQAAEIAGLSLASEYATRCSELLRLGFLETTGRTVRSKSGTDRRVLRITAAGESALRARGE